MAKASKKGRGGGALRKFLKKQQKKIKRDRKRRGITGDGDDSDKKKKRKRQRKLKRIVGPSKGTKRRRKALRKLSEAERERIEAKLEKQNAKFKNGRTEGGFPRPPATAAQKRAEKRKKAAAKARKALSKEKRRANKARRELKRKQKNRKNKKRQGQESNTERRARKAREKKKRGGVPSKKRGLFKKRQNTKVKGGVNSGQGKAKRKNKKQLRKNKRKNRKNKKKLRKNKRKNRKNKKRKDRKNKKKLRKNKRKNRKNKKRKNRKNKKKLRKNKRKNRKNKRKDRKKNKRKNRKNKRKDRKKNKRKNRKNKRKDRKNKRKDRKNKRKDKKRKGGNRSAGGGGGRGRGNNRRGRGRFQQVAEQEQQQTTAAEQMRMKAREATPHQYVEHQQQETTIMSSEGKLLHAPVMVEPYEVARIRLHIDDESEENVPVEPTVLLMESEDVLSADGSAIDDGTVSGQMPKPKFAVRVVDPRKKHKGKKKKAWFVPKYLAEKKKKNQKPPVYLSPEYAKPPTKETAENGQVVIHLKVRNPPKPFVGGHLSVGHVKSYNEEALADVDTVTPQYVASKRALKTFFAPKKVAKKKKKVARELFTAETYGLHALHGKPAVVPEWAPPKKKKTKSHAGIWPRAKILNAAKKGLVFLEEEELVSDEGENEDEEETEEEDEYPVLLQLAEEEEDEEEGEDEEAEDEEEEEESEEESEEEADEEESEVAFVATHADTDTETATTATTVTATAIDASTEKPKNKKKKPVPTFEPAYSPPKISPTGYISPEYRAVAAPKRKSRKPQPTVFKTSYFSPFPKTKKLKKKNKMNKTPSLPLQRIETPEGRLLKLNGWVNPTYDDKLMLKWRPKKEKRTLVPAPVAFAELHYSLIEMDGKPAKVPPYPTTKLRSKPIIVKKGRSHFFPRGKTLPVFSNSKIETAEQQTKNSAKYAQYVQVEHPDYFKPRPRRHKHHPKPRFVSSPSSSTSFSVSDAVTAVAEEVSLPAVPSASALPALQLESSPVEAALGKHEQRIVSEIEAIGANSLEVSDAEAARRQHAVEEGKTAINNFFTEVKALLKRK